MVFFLKVSIEAQASAHFKLVKTEQNIGEKILPFLQKRRLGDKLLILQNDKQKNECYLRLSNLLTELYFSGTVVQLYFSGTVVLKYFPFIWIRFLKLKNQT